MTIKRFLLISIAIHLMAFAGIYLLPEPQTKKAREFFTRLITPEEARTPEKIPPPIKQMPTQPRAKVVPTVPMPMRLQPPATSMPSKIMPSPDIPVVPGEGKNDGKPIPEGASPRPGKSEIRGDDHPEDISSRPGYMKSGRPPGRRDATMREKLFDRAVIGDTALKGEGGKKKKDTLTFDSKDYRYAGYMRKLKEKIESIWEYPAEAGKKGLYGDLKISFTIKKDGKLGAVELIRTSGYKILDDAALKALRDGEPYWPIPDDWEMDSYTINGHFFYTIYGYGIR